MKHSLILAACLSLAMAALGQEKAATDMEIVREKLRADKKLLVADNMQLTEAETKGFWPVYESYQQDLAKLNDRQRKVINDYAASYESMTDDTAGKLLAEAVAIEQGHSSLMQAYVPKFSAVLPAKKVARYYQIENKIRAVVNYGLAEYIPLVE